MPRPRLRRWVAAIPKATYFKPQGIPLRELEEIRLPIEGLEALRLADLEGLTAEAAAAGMGVSRHTFGRVLAEARTSVARALVGGAALRIEGGHYGLAQAQGILESQDAQSGEKGAVVAIPSQGDTLDSLVEPRVDQAVSFALVDLDNRSTRHLQNGWRTGRGRGGWRHILRSLRAAGAHVLLAGPSFPGFAEMASRAGLRVFEYVPLSSEETVGEAVDRLAGEMS